VVHRTRRLAIEASHPGTSAPSHEREREHVIQGATGDWTDRLGASFSDLDLALFPCVGHFPHREDPDRAAAEIAAFFQRVGWR